MAINRKGARRSLRVFSDRSSLRCRWRQLRSPTTDASTRLRRFTQLSIGSAKGFLELRPSNQEITKSSNLLIKGGMGQALGKQEETHFTRERDSALAGVEGCRNQKQPKGGAGPWSAYPAKAYDCRDGMEQSQSAPAAFYRRYCKWTSGSRFRPSLSSKLLIDDPRLLRRLEKRTGAYGMEE